MIICINLNKSKLKCDDDKEKYGIYVYGESYEFISLFRWLDRRFLIKILCIKKTHKIALHENLYFCNITRIE